MIKRKYIYYIFSISALIAFIVLIFTAYYRISLYSSENTGYSRTEKVIVDAGHGGEDGGAVSDDGVVEKDINLDISRKLSDFLKLFGYDVTETRTEDVSVFTDGNTVRERKVSDLKNRLSLFNSDKSNIVISIHQNKFTESKYYGTQIFYSPNNEESVLLAENIRNTVVTLLQPDNTRECKKADSNIYLLKNAEVPAVIVECGFISNYNECQKLVSSDYQKQMAYSISLGFIGFYNNDYQ